jgi:signal peptide peptidase SppA
MSNPLIARFAGEPTFVEPSQVTRFEACLNAVVAHAHSHEMMSADSPDEPFWPEPDSWKAQLRPYIVRDGILQIPVKGALLHNFSYALFDWATGYEYIWQAFKRGAADFAIGQIKGIALVCDTPGGMAAGCFDARDKMLALKDETGVPVAGFAHEAAYSAGYAIITVADPGQIAVSRTGGVGSIGVVTGHLDVSGAMEKAGLKFTYISAGEGKTDGNPYEALSPEAKARTQARIDEMYGIFVAAVARSRSLEESVIRETLGAHCYTATQAVSNGLADTVGSFEDAVSAFADFLDAPSDNPGDEEMTTQVATVDQAVHESAVAAARNEATEAGRAAGVVEGAAAERTRIAAIMALPEAKDRATLATHLAMTTSMSAEDAKGILAASAIEKAAAPEATGQSGFDTAMQNGNPDVGADGGPGGKNADADAQTNDVLALIRGAGLPGFKPAAGK